MTDLFHFFFWYKILFLSLLLNLSFFSTDEPGKSGLVSEKLYDAFLAGVVPIYWGAPRRTVERLAPSPESFIHVDDFHGNLKLLSEHLLWLSRNPTEYAKHHAWRARGPTKNFCQLLETNVNTLACRVCETVEERRRERVEKEEEEEVVEVAVVEEPEAVEKEEPAVFEQRADVLLLEAAMLRARTLWPARQSALRSNFLAVTRDMSVGMCQDLMALLSRKRREFNDHFDFDRLLQDLMVTL